MGNDHSNEGAVTAAPWSADTGENRLHNVWGHDQKLTPLAAKENFEGIVTQSLWATRAKN